MAILRKKAEIEGREVPIEVCQYIAERIPTNIRELEGALIRVLAFTGLQKRPVTVEVTKEVLHDLLPDKKPLPITIDSIKKVVADHTATWQISRRNAVRGIAFPRQVAMYLCRTLTDASSQGLASSLAGATTPPYYTPATKSMPKGREFSLGNTRPSSPRLRRLVRKSLWGTLWTLTWLYVDNLCKSKERRHSPPSYPQAYNESTDALMEEIVFTWTNNSYQQVHRLYCCCCFRYIHSVIRARKGNLS